MESQKLTIAEIRRSQHRTQMDVAKALDIALATVQGIEKGRQLPRVDLAVKLAQYFGVAVEEINWIQPEPGRRGKEQGAAA